MKKVFEVIVTYKGTVTIEANKEDIEQEMNRFLNTDFGFFGHNSYGILSIIKAGKFEKTNIKFSEDKKKIYNR